VPKNDAKNEQKNDPKTNRKTTLKRTENKLQNAENPIKLGNSGPEKDQKRAQN
jgi:hypothetical protein